MKLIRILITILLTISINLSIVNLSNALYTEDLTITGTNGIWTDVRSYISLSDAISAIGSKQQTLLIPVEVTCSDLTIPSNITLKFVKTGAINNSGTLTIQTTNIIADHNQIFTGSGSVNFADNTEVKASWFPSLYNAINQTSNNKVCLIIDKQYTLSTSIPLGNNVILKFSSPVSTISTDSNVTLSNISKVISSKGIIFTGSGNFDFTQGSIIHTSWFTSFRRAITYTFDDNVLETLLLDSDGSLDTDVTINSYTTLKVLKGYYITIPSGLTLTINGDIDAGNYQIFSGDGNIIFSDNSELKSSWFSSFETAIAKINSAKVNLIVTSPATISNNCTINSNISLSIPCPNRILTISSGKTLTINGPFSAGLYQVFSGDGDVESNNLLQAYPEWFGALRDGITDDTVACNKAIAFTNRVFFSSGQYLINPYPPGILLHSNSHLILSSGTILKAKANDFERYDIFKALNASNILIDGNGALIQGERNEHTGSTGEWGFGIDFRGVKNSVIQNLTIVDCWGDGLYIAASDDNDATTRCENIKIQNVVIKNSRRNNISVVGGKYIYFNNVICQGANGTAPEAGIDLEPNNQTIVNEFLYFNQCSFIDNNVYQFIAASNSTKHVNVSNCYFNCNTLDSTTYPNRRSICIGSPTPSPEGNVITNFVIDNSNFVGLSCVFVGTKFDNCSFCNGCNNRSFYSDGAIEDIYISNSTFYDNGNRYIVFAQSDDYGKHTYINNCHFVYNGNAIASGEAYLASDSQVLFNNCRFEHTGDVPAENYYMPLDSSFKDCYIDPILNRYFNGHYGKKTGNRDVSLAEGTTGTQTVTVSLQSNFHDYHYNVLVTVSTQSNCKIGNIMVINKTCNSFDIVFDVISSTGDIDISFYWEAISTLGEYGILP